MVFRLRNARSGPGLPVILALLFTAMTIAIPWSHSGSQAQAAASDNSKPEHWISIRIHEGPVVTYVTEACELLHQDGLLPLQQTELRKGESVGIAYKRMLDNVPFWLNDLAGTLNQKTPSEMRRLLPGTPIVAPRMEVTVKEYKRTINQRDPNQKLLLERLITAGYKTEKLTRDPGYLNVIAKSNQLLFRFETREQLNSALSKLREYVRNVNDSSRLVMPSIRLDSSLYYENLKFTPFAAPSREGQSLPLSSGEVNGLSTADLQNNEYWLGGLLGGSEMPASQQSAVKLVLFDLELKGHWELPQALVLEPETGEAPLQQPSGPNFAEQIREIWLSTLL